MMRLRLFIPWMATGLALGAVACEGKESGTTSTLDEGGGIMTMASDESSGADGSATGGSSTGGGDGCPPGGCLDTQPADTGGTGCGMEGTNCPTCEVPEHVPCDTTDDIIKALGLNCGNGEPIMNVSVGGAPQQAGTGLVFGLANALPPTEGARYAVLGSGHVSDLNQVNGTSGLTAGPCSRDVAGGWTEPLNALPPPIRTTNVGAVTCADDPTLIGTGDCSNTIQDEFNASANGAFDYAEIRISGSVPTGVSSFSYDFAFFSFEYPEYYNSQFNDIYVGWLESAEWTGNISFDDNGQPISVNAGFMDYLDADALGHPVCPTGTGCSAPELQGTCMQGHGGTRWLSTTATVMPGEDVEIVLAIMDLGDGILDSYVFLDNFLWGCEGGNPPTTAPID